VAGEMAEMFAVNMPANTEGGNTYTEAQYREWLTDARFHNIEVIDLIPGIADIDKSLDIGTLKPQEIKHTKKGTLVKWKLAKKKKGR